MIWLGLAWSYILVCRPAKLWAYDDGLFHPEFCLRRRNLVFSNREKELSRQDRESASQLTTTFEAAKTDQKRVGENISRERPCGVLERLDRGVAEIGAIDTVHCE